MSQDPSPHDPTSSEVSTSIKEPQPSPASAVESLPPTSSKKETSSRVDADSLELVTFLLRVLSNESRFYKRYIDSEEGRYYYYDIRTGALTLAALLRSPSPWVARLLCFVLILS